MHSTTQRQRVKNIIEHRIERRIVAGELKQSDASNATVRCDYMNTHTLRTTPYMCMQVLSVCDFDFKQAPRSQFALASFQVVRVFLFLVFISTTCFLFCEHTANIKVIYRSPIVWPPAPISQSECIIAPSVELLLYMYCCFYLVVCHRHLHRAMERWFKVETRFYSIWCEFYCVLLIMWCCSRDYRYTFGDIWPSMRNSNDGM